MEFNAKVLEKLSKILKKDILVLWWYGNRGFNTFFNNIWENIKIAPPPGNSAIFKKDDNINWWNEKLKNFEDKHSKTQIFSISPKDKTKHLSYIKIKDKYSSLLKEYFNNVVLLK